MSSSDPSHVIARLPHVIVRLVRTIQHKNTPIQPASLTGTRLIRKYGYWHRKSGNLTYPKLQGYY